MANNIFMNDLLQARIVTHCQGQIGVNVLHFLVQAITGTPTLEGTVVAMDTLWAARYKALMSTGADYRGVGLRRLNAPATLEVVSIGNAGAGGVASDILPLNVSGIITKRSALPGRANRGRMYVAFPSEQDNDATGSPTVGYQANLVTLANGCLAGNVYVTSAGNTATCVPVIKHHTGLTWQLVSFNTAQPKWANQHRRGAYGALNPLPF